MTAFTRAKLIVLALFVVTSGGFAVYHFMYVAPGRACEESGQWWTNKWRACVTPVAVSSLVPKAPLGEVPPPAAVKAATQVAAPQAPAKAQ